MSASDPLRQFFMESARCTTKAALSEVALSTMRSAFNINVGAVIVLDAAMAPTEVALHGTRQSYLEEYNRHWRDTDPLLATVLKRRIPVHSRQVHTPEAWRRLPIVTDYGRRINIEPYMSAPIYGNGALVGLLNFCRRPHDRPFGAAEVELATALCGFLSSSFASLPRSSQAAPVPLTVRERQIALLAAQGQNNLEIALALGIARETVKQTLRRVYRKIDVRGRPEMAASLATWGWL